MLMAKYDLGVQCQGHQRSLRPLSSRKEEFTTQNQNTLHYQSTGDMAPSAYALICCFWCKRQPIHSTSLLCRLSTIINKQPPAAVPPGHCTPQSLVGSAGTHVRKTYFLQQKQIAKKHGMSCHVATKPVNHAKHSGPLFWATSTSWPADNLAKQRKPACNEIHKKYSKCFQI